MDYEKMWNDLKDELQKETDKHWALKDNHTLWEGAYNCAKSHVLSNMKELDDIK